MINKENIVTGILVIHIDRAMFQLFISKSPNHAWEILWTAAPRAANSHIHDVRLDTALPSTKWLHMSHSEKSHF